MTTALQKSAAHFARVFGTNLLARTEDYARWRASRLEADVWPFSRVLCRAPGATTVICDETGREVEGLNFGSHDYLGLSTHPAIREAAERALREFGPHVSCSPILQGNTQLSLELERALAELLGMEHILLFPTGWGAGFGIITALVREGRASKLRAVSTAAPRYNRGDVSRLRDVWIQPGMHRGVRPARVRRGLEPGSARCGGRYGGRCARPDLRGLRRLRVQLRRRRRDVAR